MGYTGFPPTHADEDYTKRRSAVRISASRKKGDEHPCFEITIAPTTRVQQLFGAWTIAPCRGCYRLTVLHNINCSLPEEGMGMHTLSV